MKTILVRAVFVVAGLCALGMASVAGGGSDALSPDLKPPALINPTINLGIQPGTGVVFRIRTHAGDAGLMLRVSHSSARGKCGAIAGEVAQYSFVRTEKPAVYEARPAGAALASSWMSTPGTYFWQAYRIGGRDGCVESSVRSFRVLPKPPLALTEARLDGVFDVTSRITAVEGFSTTVGHTSDITYPLTPGCASGPCDAALSFQAAGIVSMLSTKVTVPLVRSGSVYSGSAPAPLSRCGYNPNPVSGTLEVRLEVSGGAWFGTTWRASTIVGHERYSTPEISQGLMGSCPASSWEADLTGTSRGAGM